MAFQVVLSGLAAKTHGLNAHGLPELEVIVTDASLLPEARLFLLNMGEALQDGSIHIHPGDTVQCGYWIVKFDAKSLKGGVYVATIMATGNESGSTFTKSIKMTLNK